VGASSTTLLLKTNKNSLKEGAVGTPQKEITASKAGEA
jgi:hypothetical protein